MLFFYFDITPKKEVYLPPIDFWDFLSILLLLEEIILG